MAAFDLDSFYDGEFAAHLDAAAAARNALKAPFASLLDACTACLDEGGKILFFGNGGSASGAQHLAAELTIRYGETRRALPAISLASDSAALTAAANDFGFERVFARQIEALGRPGDVALGLSTSGRSRNVILGLETARAQGLTAAAMTGGTGGDLKGLAEPLLIVPTTATPRIQEVHILLGQMLCAGLEHRLGLVGAAP